MLLLAQDQILSLFKTYETRGMITPSELSTYYSLINSYHELGGNSEIVNTAKNSIYKFIDTNVYTPNEYRLATGMNEIINPPNAKFDVQCTIDYTQPYSISTNIYPKVQSKILDAQVQCACSKQIGFIETVREQKTDDALHDYLSNRYVVYADDKPFAVSNPITYKKHLTIYDLDRLIFPEDPIRDWVEKKTKEIDKKFAWADELMERMDI